LREVKHNLVITENIPICEMINRNYCINLCPTKPRLSLLGNGPIEEPENVYRVIHRNTVMESLKKYVVKP
jgi:hypothetical protein